MSAPPGRRERKKQLTRQAISDVATVLFLERGFDAVTIAEIAAAADVAVQTVFNHFPAKEDLFFDDVRWVAGPADAVRSAPPGSPIGAVLETYYRAMIDAIRASGYFSDTARFARTIDSSPALRARRAHLVGEMEALLVEACGGEPDWRSRLLAARYAAVQRVLDDELFRLVDEHPDDHDGVLDTFSPAIAEAFATLDRP